VVIEALILREGCTARPCGSGRLFTQQRHCLESQWWELRPRRP
jgi:hypothetical protein